MSTTDSKMKMSSNDTIKRLIKSASILVRKLDLIVAKAVNECASGNLFTDEAIELRSQLTQLCNRSMTADPVQCRRKSEELLWRKCYYEVITTAKLNAKKSPLSIVETFYLESQIDCGIAKFSELLQDIWSKLRRIENISIPFDHILSVGRVENDACDATMAYEAKEDLIDSAQRILVWLGDLSRYRCDLGISDNLIVAHRFYQQAIIVNPCNGLPFNQLGTLIGHDDSRGLEAIFYYIRSIMTPKAFSGAESNLKNLLDRLSSSVNPVVSSFAQLMSKLALKNKDENAYEIAQLCQANLSQIQTHLLNDENISHYLLDITAVMVTCTSPTSPVSKNQSTAGIAYCCSLFLHILNRFVRFFHPKTEDEEVDEKMEKVDAESNVEVEESEDEEPEELKRVRMRRRKINSDSDDDEEEFSEEELSLNSDASDSDEEDEEEEEDEEVLSDSGFNSTEARPDLDNLNQTAMEITDELSSLLPVIRLMSDWFQANSNIVHVSSQSVTEMWTALALVLNGLNAQRCRKDPLTKTILHRRYPLEEDWKCFGFDSMASIHQFDFNVPIPCSADTPELKKSLRIERIVQFGVWLSENAPESTIKCINDRFVCQPAISDDANEDDKTDLMRNMAHLWLKSEVQELERKLVPHSHHHSSKRNKKKTGSGGNHCDLVQLPYVYVVIDAVVLTDFTPLIKKIVKSQKLIVVIPDVVISEMDQLKKENQGVRDCIRWLETCFRNGNRFIRSQRQNEHQTIPLITYPKRKDKTNWVVFQILECCHFLDLQQRNFCKNDQNSPVVLFLVGQPKESTDQNIRGICTSIGVDLKTADSLNTKNSTK